MLLLLTVGLLLIGLVTLVIGFLNSSLALDYISIAASALSFALVLVFTRLGRARSARAAGAQSRQPPAPLAQSDTGVIDLGAGDSFDHELAPETRSFPAAPRAARATETPPAQAFDEPAPEDEEEDDDAVWEPEPAPQTPTRLTQGRSPYERPSPRAADVAPRPSPGPVGHFDEDGYADEGEHGAGRLDEYEDMEFPIADYDELRVAEILPLLEELEPDEIEVVRERERSSRNRAVVLRKLDELAGGAVGPPAAAPPAAPVVNGTRHRPAVERPVGAEVGDEPADLGYDEDEYVDHGVDFPIADYDDLRLTEILPLLPQLEPVELELVRQRELEGERRATLLNRIDALIGIGGGRAPARR